MAKLELHHQLTGEPQRLTLHGFMGVAQDWNWLEDTLSIDLPGHGKSHHIVADSIRNQAEAVLETLESLKFEPEHAVGYSMGGRVLLMIQELSPGYFKKMTLISTQPAIPETDRQERLRLDDERALNLEVSPHDFFDNWYKQELFIGLTQQELTLLRDRFIQQIPKRLASVLRQASPGQTPPLWNALKSFTGPMQMLVGERDRKYLEIAKRSVALAPQLKLITIPHASHNPLLSHQKDLKPCILGL